MGEQSEREEQPAVLQAASPPRREVHSWSSAQLLGEANEARIEHGGEVYRLLRTRNDKLILVK